MTEQDETLDHSVPRKMTDRKSGVNGGRIEVLPCLMGANSAPSQGMLPLSSCRPEVEAQKGVGEMGALLLVREQFIWEHRCFNIYLQAA